MYQDPKRVRTKSTVYLDQYEADVITALANYLGVPKAEVMRQMMMKEAREVLGLGTESSVHAPTVAAEVG
ncbi:hypothetical protein [Halomonas elongata]|uniref:hypothetical protein n=1 Tax=Halomonas elongata TaxID=2746 RepID=UPI0023AE9DF8|nr:hypothetical protein [Halomonas elongata]